MQPRILGKLLFAARMVSVLVAGAIFLSSGVSRSVGPEWESEVEEATLATRELVSATDRLRRRGAKVRPNQDAALLSCRRRFALHRAGAAAPRLGERVACGWLPPLRC